MKQFAITITLWAVLIACKCQTPLQVLGAFQQGSKGNCASIAIIKTSMAAFGVHQVFSSVQQHNNGSCMVTLRNDTVISTTSAVVATIAKKADFKLLDSSDRGREIYEQAKFCFAIMVLTASRMNNDTSIAKAVSFINRGVNTDVVYRYIGLPDTAIELLYTDEKGTKNPTEYSNNNLYILYNNIHAAMAIGTQYDEYGTTEAVTNFRNNHKHLLKPDRDFWAYRVRTGN